MEALLEDQSGTQGTSSAMVDLATAEVVVTGRQVGWVQSEAVGAEEHTAVEVPG